MEIVIPIGRGEYKLKFEGNSDGIVRSLQGTVGGRKRKHYFPLHRLWIPKNARNDFAKKCIFLLSISRTNNILLFFCYSGEHVSKVLSRNLFRL